MSFFVFYYYNKIKNMSSYRLNAYCDKYNINILYLDKCKDFALYLAAVINEKYLGDEFMIDGINEKHFEFWWEKSSVEFSKISNVSVNTISAKTYFKNLFLRLFYNSKLTLDKRTLMLTATISALFNFNSYYEGDFDIILSLNTIFLKDGENK